MAYHIGPSEASRLVFSVASSPVLIRGLLRGNADREATYYVDPDPTATPTLLMLTQLAAVRNLDGSVISGSTVTIDSESMLPLMRFPEGDPAPDTLLVSVEGGVPSRVYAREDDRIDEAISTAAGAVGTAAGLAIVFGA